MKMTISPFTYAANRRVIFSPGSFCKLPAEASFFGTRCILVTGGNSLRESGRLDSLLKEFAACGIECMHFTVNGEPSPGLINGITAESAGKADFVVSVGGGSAIDTGKAVSAMLCESGSVSEFLEGVGDRIPSGKKLPFIAVPTTAGTGSEATSNAVISSVGPEGFKKSLRHVNYTPDLAVVDAELYASCPPDVAAASGLDALSQLIEAYISVKSNFYTDMQLSGAIEAALEAVPIVGGAATDQKSRDGAWLKMAYAAYISGLALANVGLGSVHGIAGPAGGFFKAPHGALCGTLLAPVMKHTIKKLENEDPESPWLLKFSRLGNTASGSYDLLPRESRFRFIQILENLAESLCIPRLSAYGITEKDIPVIAGASSNKNHPVSFNSEEFEAILKERL